MSGWERFRAAGNVEAAVVIAPCDNDAKNFSNDSQLDSARVSDCIESLMKTAILSLMAILMSGGLLHAAYSQRKLESSIASATKSGKLIAFVFYQDYALPNCPTCVSSTNANNKAIKSAIPRSHVVLIEIDPGEKNLDKLPACVDAKGGSPRLVITDAKGEKVITSANGAPDRDKAKEIKTIVEKARSGK